MIKIYWQKASAYLLSSFAVYTFCIYLYINNTAMKTLSLKLDDDIFSETDAMANKLKIARNRYINEALNIYNMVNKRKLLKKKLAKESKLVRKDSMEILAEFEKLMDDYEAI
jgi:hypothetical protein